MIPLFRRVRRRALRALVAIAIVSVTSPSTALAAPSSPTILVFGDSLSAGYGLAQDEGWVTLLQRRLAQRHLDFAVSNASISGETTSGGLTRIDEALGRVKPAIVIIELGANDALRGQPLDQTQRNLEALVTKSQAAHAKVVIVGMQIPPNYGKVYADRFQGLFGAVATKYHTALAPFLFAGFAEKLDLFQADHFHPNAEAQPRLLDNVWPALEPLLNAMVKPMIKGR
jgi:acyl-CoA thioesterase I